MTHLPSAMDIDIDDITRGGSTSSNKISSKSVSVVSDASSIPYHLRIEINNDFPDEIRVKSIDSSQLSYQDNVEEGSNPVSEAANSSSTKKSQHIQHNVPALNKTPKPWGKSVAINNTNMNLPQEDIINIQLSYDPNQPTEKDLWNGNF